MKKLDTEVLQYNYRAFPDEFTWELTDETPEGHLPLTNALRGTQLLSCILSHPAFATQQEETPLLEEEEQKQSKLPVGKGLFKTNYSF
ncbi:putative GUN4-like superfamily protein [Helianthus annuus]|nr:putative GUN4-like superfamily protein [Helianthus annuus]